MYVVSIFFRKTEGDSVKERLFLDKVEASNEHEALGKAIENGAKKYTGFNVCYWSCVYVLMHSTAC